MTELKRSLDIEAALRWAFRDELPKTAVREAALEAPDFLAKPGSGWGAVENYAELLTRIDANRYGVVPHLLDLGEPHPDAILIGEAVKALDGAELEIPTDWNPIEDLGDLGDAGRECIHSAVQRETIRSDLGVRRLRTSPSVLVTKYALLGRGACPEWECDVPELRIVSANGKPKWFMKRLVWSKSCDNRDVYVEVEVDGYNERAKRPYTGAYRKHYLSPDPSLSILGRAEYEVWHFALSCMTDDLAPQLTSIELAPFRRSPRPWMERFEVPSLAPSLADLAAPLTGFPRHGGQMRPEGLTCGSRLP